MEVVLSGNKLVQHLTIDEALALQAGLASAVRHALKYSTGMGPTICGFSTTLIQTNDRPVPLAVSFVVQAEDQPGV